MFFHIGKTGNSLQPYSGIERCLTVLHARGYLAHNYMGTDFGATAFSFGPKLYVIRSILVLQYSALALNYMGTDDNE